MRQDKGTPQDEPPQQHDVDGFPALRILAGHGDDGVVDAELPTASVLRAQSSVVVDNTTRMTMPDKEHGNEEETPKTYYFKHNPSIVEVRAR